MHQILITKGEGSRLAVVYSNEVCTQANACLLEWHKAGRLGRTNTGGSVLHWLVGHGELSQVVANHVSL